MFIRIFIAGWSRIGELMIAYHSKSDLSRYILENIMPYLQNQYLFIQGQIDYLYCVNVYITKTDISNVVIVCPNDCIL